MKKVKMSTYIKLIEWEVVLKYLTEKFVKLFFTSNSYKIFFILYNIYTKE